MSPVRLLVGSLTLLVFALNTLFWCVWLFAVTAVKLLLPFPAARRFLGRVQMAIGSLWIDGNSLGLRLTQGQEWDVAGLDGLAPDRWYLVVVNHRSWADIAVLQRVFNHRIPFLKFFLKQQLVWVPVLGQAWWALDFPFMKRYAREELERRPELRGRDLETARRACERFRASPVAVLNFLEGTRFSEEKRARLGSPFRHLLPPKAGGAAAVLAALGDRLDSLVDVTIAYPAGTPSFWDLLSRGVPRIVVRVRRVPIPRELLGGDWLADETHRERLRAWVHALWEEKDAALPRLLGEAERRAAIQ